jgi:hypothetical protein
VNKVSKAFDATTTNLCHRICGVVSCKLPPLELASNACLEIEGSIVCLPFAIVRQLEVIPTYDLRRDLLDLSHSNLNQLVTAYNKK